MAEYVEPIVEREPGELAQAAYDYLAEQVPGWEPAAGNLDTILIDAFARLASDVRELAADVPETIWRTFGEQLLGIPPRLASYASADATFTTRDAAGYLIPAGSALGIRRPDGQLEGFATAEDLTIPAGETTGTMLIAALEAGARASGLSAGPGEVLLLDALAFVETVTVAGPTAGGADDESDDDYFDRLASAARLLSPRPVLAEDFAVIAMQHPAVERAVALSGYDPGPPPATGVERAVTVFMVDAAGEPVSAAVKAEVDAQLEAMREANFLVFEADPTYTTVDVAWQVAALPGFIGATLDVAVTDALTAYLSPANWGIPPFGDVRGWRNVTVVRYLEVAEVINRVEGVDYIVSLGIAATGGTPGTADVALAGVVPLTRPGAIGPSAPAIEQPA